MVIEVEGPRPYFSLDDPTPVVVLQSNASRLIEDFRDWAGDGSRLTGFSLGRKDMQIAGVSL